jgi:hypothetical protein
MVYLQRPVFQLLCTWSMLYQILFYFCVPLLVNAVLQVIRWFVEAALLKGALDQPMLVLFPSLLVHHLVKSLCPSHVYLLANLFQSNCNMSVLFV